MSFVLTDYQDTVKQKCYRSYRDGAQVVMPVMPTGSGKSVLTGSIAHEYEGYGLTMAHRGHLVGQLSVALAREGMQHDIIAPDSVIRTIVNWQMEDIGRSFYNPRAKWKLASVDTIIQRDLPRSWLLQVGMVQIDEGHHVLRDNKWGRAFQLFENAYGLFPTATPERADGRGLGRHADGFVDTMVEGPGMRWLIEQGHLTPYVIRGAKPEDLDLEDLEVSSDTGDFNQNKMRKRVKASARIVGDVVKIYKEHAYGKKGITFAVDTEHAQDICRSFNEAGISAVVMQDSTPEAERRRIMTRLKTGDLMMLVNVDLIGEGVDVPIVEVVIMARPTASYALYVQQFGRVLRLLVEAMYRQQWHSYTAEQRQQIIANSAKPFGLVIDLVGNVIRHGGPPDWRTEPWSLDPREKKRGATDGIPLRLCVNLSCMQPYLRIFPACPYCGQEPPPPADRSRPAFVDGDVILYTPELLEELLSNKKKIDSDFVAIPYGMGHRTPAAQAIRNRHAADQAAQAELRKVISLLVPPFGNERLNQRKFFLTFGIDVLTAQGLTCAEATALKERIIQEVTRK